MSDKGSFKMNPEQEWKPYIGQWIYCNNNGLAGPVVKAEPLTIRLTNEKDHVVTSNFFLLSDAKRDARLREIGRHYIGCRFGDLFRFSGGVLRRLVNVYFDSSSLKYQARIEKSQSDILLNSYMIGQAYSVDPSFIKIPKLNVGELIGRKREDWTGEVISIEDKVVTVKWECFDSLCEYHDYEAEILEKFTDFKVGQFVSRDNSPHWAGKVTSVNGGGDARVEWSNEIFKGPIWYSREKIFKISEDRFKKLNEQVTLPEQSAPSHQPQKRGKTMLSSIGRFVAMGIAVTCISLAVNNVPSMVSDVKYELTSWEVDDKGQAVSMMISTPDGPLAIERVEVGDGLYKWVDSSDFSEINSPAIRPLINRAISFIKKRGMTPEELDASGLKTISIKRRRVPLIGEWEAE